MKALKDKGEKKRLLEEEKQRRKEEREVKKQAKEEEMKCKSELEAQKAATRERLNSKINNPDKVQGGKDIILETTPLYQNTCNTFYSKFFISI